MEKKIMRCRVYCKMDNYNRKIILLRESRGKKKYKTRCECSVSCKLFDM